MNNRFVIFKFHYGTIKIFGIFQRDNNNTENSKVPLQIISLLPRLYLTQLTQHNLGTQQSINLKINYINT